MAKVTMPQLGESVAEGTIGKWLKQPGDHVDKYEPLVEVITDKVNAEVPSPFEGVLREILAEEGATVPNNAEIAVIETANDGGTATAGSAATPIAKAASQAAEPEASGEKVLASQAEKSGTATGPAGSDERGPGEMAAATPAPLTAATSAPPAAAPPAAGDPEARMTPAVRRLLREHELSAAQIVGTGGGGRITREDVLKVIEVIRQGGAAPAVPAPAIGIAPVAATAPRTPPGARVQMQASCREPAQEPG